MSSEEIFEKVKEIIVEQLSVIGLFLFLEIRGFMLNTGVWIVKIIIKINKKKENYINKIILR